MDDLLNRFTAMSKAILGNNLAGIYLHGSAAMGCFNPLKSDLDLLLAVEGSMSKQEKLQFMKELIKLNQEAPAKGIELSIVKKAFCKPFVYPTDYELHFSARYLNWFREKPDDYVEKMNGTDKDLAAHVMVIHHCGVVLAGAPVKDIFGEVPAENYLDSIWHDIKDAKKAIRSDLMYLTLNLCRVLGYLKENLILSKKTGGEWGLAFVPETYRGLIQQALTCYESDREMTAEPEMASQYAEYMLDEIKKLLSKGQEYDIIYRT